MEERELNNNIKVEGFWQEIAVYRQFMYHAGIRNTSFILPAIFALLASAFEGLSLALLVPLIKGAIEQDYTLIQTLPVIGDFVRQLPPEFFSGNRYPVLLLVGVTFTASILKVGFQYGAIASTKRIVRSFARGLRSAIHRRFLSFGKLYFDRKNSGVLQQYLTSYISDISGTLEPLQNGLIALCTLIVYLGIMLKISWQFTLIVLCLFPILHFSLSRLLKIIQRISQEISESFLLLAGRIANSLSAVFLVKAYTAEDLETEQFAEVNEGLERLENRLDTWTLLIGPIQEIVSLLFLFLLIGIVAISIKLEGDWRLAEYTVFLLILRRSSRMFGTLNFIRSALAEVRGPLEYLSEVFTDKDKFVVRQGEKVAPPLSKSIEIRDLTFLYPDGSIALDQISCTFKQGELIALVGQSGSGKSTIMNLLMRFYEAPAGTLLLDGVDVAEYTLESWRKQIALVSQDAQLFNGTLRENLLYGIRREVSDDELKSILNRASLQEFSEKLQNGLETLIGDRGVRLSGGEKQRVSIARAMLKGAAILFLDEATSALDSKTERSIQDALTELVEDKTSIVIAHRLSTIKEANHVIVLEEGKIVEQGKVEELLAQQGKFFSYWQEQKFE
jgi:subfamily B ATP-binding cassette protein MsbA